MTSDTMSRALWPIIGACVISVLPVALLPAQGDGEPKIQEAIQLGLTGKTGEIVLSCEANGSFMEGVALGATVHSGTSYSRGYNVQFTTNMGRIAAAAEFAKRIYKPFSRSDVTDAMLKPAVYTYVRPQDPTQSGAVMNVAPPLVHVVLKSRAKENVVVHPDSLAIVPVEWLYGGSKWMGNQATAVFSFEAVKALPAGDFEIILVTDGGERRCRVDSGARRKLSLL